MEMTDSRLKSLEASRAGFNRTTLDNNVSLNCQHSRTTSSNASILRLELSSTEHYCQQLPTPLRDHSRHTSKTNVALPRHTHTHLPSPPTPTQASPLLKTPAMPCEAPCSLNIFPRSYKQKTQCPFPPGSTEARSAFSGAWTRAHEFSHLNTPFLSQRVQHCK